ncbi:MAG: hypothetical protein P8183_04915 [Anaerolineae bacterium]|jgi:predicted metal-dependent HD superfamily phosphohydrolase
MKPTDKVWLRRQWDDLMAFYGVDLAQAEPVWLDVVGHYEGNGRYYHTLRHIQNVLAFIDSAHDHAVDLPSIKLAAWFHDVIYDVHRSDNETQSAIYAGRVLQKLGVPADTIAKVGYMIRATKHNLGCPDDIDCQIMLDADLATFASEWEVQIEIEEAIRQEYAFVPEADYRAGRQIILQNFLKRERIYCTPQMYAEREEAARQNIKRTVAALD